MLTHSPAKPLRILVVEDHPLIALALKVALEGLGEEVVAEASDAAGVRGLSLTGIDLAFVDVNLADGPTGPAIAAFLAEQGISVVFHTSNPEAIPASFTQALAVLEKPSTVTGLFQVIQLVRFGLARGAAG